MLEGLFDFEVVHRDMEEKRAEVKKHLNYPRTYTQACMYTAVLKSKTEAL